MTVTTATQIEIRPLAGRIGALVEGADLTAHLDQSAVADIRAALLAHKVIFFRGQEGLDPAGHAAFASRFGPLTQAHPTVRSAALEDEPVVFELDSDKGARANNWHTDVTFTDRPPAASFLRGVTFPPYGGDTVWANTVTAYETLPESLRALADGARAVHTNAYDYARDTGSIRDTGSGQSSRGVEFTSTTYETEHPVVRVHPETGERSLLLGGFARQIRGLSSSESADLIRNLQARVTLPENTVRWQWRVGDVAVWDNRATQHYAINDYGDAKRVVQRVTIAGAVPVGVDGQPSQVLKGDASEYSPVGPV